LKRNEDKGNLALHKKRSLAAAKPFICASKEEAQELVLWARNHEKIARAAEAHINLDRDILPEFVRRCADALENNEE